MNKVITTEVENASVVIVEPHIPDEAHYINNRNFGGYRGCRGKQSFEDLVGTFVAESGKRTAKTESRLDSVEKHMANIGASLKLLESQVGQITKQLTSQPLGAIQKIADPNLREVNAIFIQHEENGVVSREEKKVKFTPIKDEKPTLTKRVRAKKKERYDSNQCIDISLLPYPHRFLQLQAKFQKKKFFDDLKNIHTNIYSADQGEVKFEEETRRNLPQKMLYPGEVVVPYEIGGQLVEKAICDSGANVNIMPSSLYENLGLSRIKPTEVILQQADKSVKVPLGCVEDVELKIDKLRLQADFGVLDMENSKHGPIILGRPFLATAGNIIDLKQIKLTMDVEGQKVEIKASKSSHDPP
ncbi:uncharacterized protein [Primulina eburnea]|uniref:uncharacterized protein n=1 Tax=Primulina eburnea TaxID=1245227 RepID=UPI003C6C498D